MRLHPLLRPKLAREARARPPTPPSPIAHRAGLHFPTIAAASIELMTIAALQTIFALIVHFESEEWTPPCFKVTLKP
jgi:hypothetical protein